MSTTRSLLPILIAIGKIDASIARMVAERKKLEGEVNERQLAVKKLQSEVEGARRALQEKRRRYESEEKVIKEERDKLIVRRKALSSMSNYKVQQAAEREIDHTVREINSREENLFPILEEAERIENELKVREEAFTGLTSELATLVKDAQEALETFKSRDTRYQEERAELASQVDKNALQTYDRIRQRYPMDPVIPLNGTSCTGCFMQVGPQVLVLIARGDTLTRCPGCGRIVYQEATKEESGA